LRCAVRLEIGRDTAGHDAVHHQAMAEARGCRAQYVLAENSAMRVHDGERCIVANGANVAQVIGQPLELRHQRAQITRTRRHIDAERGLDRMRKRDAVGDRAVAGSARGKLRGPRDGRALHQRFDALVHIAEALFQEAVSARQPPFAPAAPDRDRAG